MAGRISTYLGALRESMGLARRDSMKRLIFWNLPALGRGLQAGDRLKDVEAGEDGAASEAPANPLREFFERRETGAGIWKWDHYFDVYHRHLERFVGRSPRVLEVGIYAGGSLEMWPAYFGEGAVIHGVDIEDACRKYETEQVRIHIGDQADRNFWANFRSEVPPLDIIIDDGGHRPEQQMVTLEEMLSHLRPGGIYICEDIHGDPNAFGYFAAGLSHLLHASAPRGEDPVVSAATPFQAAVASVHTYPYMLVVERNERPVKEFISLRRGDRWQPF